MKRIKRGAPRQTEIGGGTNARSLNDTIGTTGRGLPDEALAPGETLEDELVPEDRAGEGARERWPALRRNREAPS
jgi:hypothetical protein